MPPRTFEPIDKPAKRIEDPAAVEAARRPWCEWCGRDTRNGCHVHHVRSRGARGGDVAPNLCSLCYLCHGKFHDGNIRRALFDAAIDLRNRLLRREPDGLVFCLPCMRLARPLFHDGAFHCHRCSRELPAAGEAPDAPSIPV